MILLSVVGAYRCRQYAHWMIRPIDITQTLEYQEARWADANLYGARIMVPGSISFWMNIFTETPQAAGGFDMSLSNIQNLAETYIVWNGFENDATSADLALLWLKAYAVEAVGTGNEHTREYYRGWKRPDRFVGTSDESLAGRQRARQRRNLAGARALTESRARCASRTSDAPSSRQRRRYAPKCVCS